MTIFDAHSCHLGEGPFWHPKREQLFWFDILSGELRSQVNGQARVWSFDECVSAAGWFDEQHLLIASETGLYRFNLDTQQKNLLAPLEQDNPNTRSNDGRTDPQGGFWVGTMGKGGEPEAGAIYRYYQGELRQLHTGLTITNSICFSPCGSVAYFADTPTQCIYQQAIDPVTGWPTGDKQLWRDFSGSDIYPDGAIVDNQGHLWVAQWGLGRVVCYGPSGDELGLVRVTGALQTTCPAWAGRELNEVMITSAREQLDAQAMAAQPNAGCVHLVSAAELKVAVGYEVKGVAAPALATNPIRP